MNDIFVKTDSEIKTISSSETSTVQVKTYDTISLPTKVDESVQVQSCLKEILKESPCLKTNNLLSEIDTEYKKAKARENLGINLEDAEIKLIWDDELDKLKISDKDNTYISSCFEKLEPPLAPIIAVTTYYVATGDATITITNNKVGSSLFYSLDGNTYMETNGIFNLASGFTNTSTNVDKTYKVFVKAQYNGEYSSINYYTITIKPKCTPGTLVIFRSPDNNYATQATIEYNPSTMLGVTNYYSNDRGNTWNEFNSSFTNTINSSVEEGLYLIKVVCDNYLESITKNSEIILNALKTYYGCSTKDVLTSTDINLLTGGNALESSGLQKNIKYSLTLTLPSYVWICQSITLIPSAILHESTDTIPAGFNDAIIINGYNCYRSMEIWKAGTSSIYLKS